MNIITRKEAKDSGLVRYFTGLPCKNGHTAERYTNNGKCVVCKFASVKVWQANNRDKVRKYSSNWFNNNKDHHHELTKKWHADNREKVKERKINERIAKAPKTKQEIDEKRKYNRERKQLVIANNPAKYRAIQQNQRSRRRNGRLSHNIVERLMKLQRGRCTVCGKPLQDDYHIDHIMPLALGGENADGNVQLLHPTCNLRKTSKHPVEFMQSLGFLL